MGALWYQENVSSGGFGSEIITRPPCHVLRPEQEALAYLGEVEHIGHGEVRIHMRGHAYRTSLETSRDAEMLEDASRFGITPGVTRRPANLADMDLEFER